MVERKIVTRQPRVDPRLCQVEFSALVIWYIKSIHRLYKAWGCNALLMGPGFRALYNDHGSPWYMGYTIATHYLKK